jgi:hypothetical protein
MVSYKIIDIFQNPIYFKKLTIFKQIYSQILRAYAYIGPKNLGIKRPKRSILASKWGFERCLISFFLILSGSLLESTPSSVFWTVCTTDVYGVGTGHLDNDNYFTVFDRHGKNPFFPPNTGFEMGILSCKEVTAEAGVDYLGGTNHPLFFNLGVSLPENKMFYSSPAIKVIFFNAGTNYFEPDRTDQNIVSFIFGKRLPNWIGGRLCIGGFFGSQSLGEESQGFMISYQRSFCPVKDERGKEYFKWVLATDYASGRNFIGGGGFGVYYYFTPDISVLSGPVWFNSKEILGDWKWSIQIDISFSVFNKNN